MTASVLLGITGAICLTLSNIPLVRDFDYDYQFILNLVYGLLIPLYLIHTHYKGPLNQPSPGGRIRNVVVITGILPLASSLIACDWWEGLKWYGLLVLVSLPLYVMLYLWITSLTDRLRIANLIWLGVWLGSIFSCVFYLWHTSTVSFVHPFLGYFSGPIYDYYLGFSRDLLWQRALHLFLTCLLILLYRLRLRPSFKLWWYRSFSTVLVLVLMGGNNLFFSRTYGKLKQAMAGPFVFGACHIYVFKDLLSTLQIQNLGRECAFIVAQQSQTLAVVAQPFDLFFYRSTQEKKNWMGAGQTQFADVFNRSIHMVYRSPYESTLSHEIAHIMSTAFAPWIKFTLNIALLEGVAKALEFSSAHFTLHQNVRAMQLLKKAPDIQAIMSPLFWREAGDRAYTMAGSIVLFLLDQYGPTKFKLLYQGKDFVSIYGLAFEDFLKNWQVFIEKIRLPLGALEMARTRYALKGAFGRHCLRKVARLKHSIAEISDSQQKKRLTDLLCVLNPADHWNKVRKINLLLLDVDQEPALRQLRQVLALWQAGKIENWVQVELLEKLADLRPIHESLPIYRRLDQFSISPAFKRRLYFKVYAAEKNDRQMLGYLQGKGGLNLEKTDWHSLYLQGRHYFNQARYQAAIDRLQQAIGRRGPGEARFPVFMESEIYFIIGQANFFLGNYLAALHQFDLLLNKFTHAIHERSVQTWRQRAAYFMKNFPNDS